MYSVGEITMNNVKSKGKLIRKYIGEGIAPFKFQYKGYVGDTWQFEKVQGNIRQTIAIYLYRFDRGMMSFDLFTSARGTGIVQAGSIEGVETNSYLPGFWKYENEEEFTQILMVMRDVLIKKGMKILRELSVEEKMVATNEMYHELYEKYEQLCNSFLKKTELLTTGFDPENINRWFDEIDKRVEILRQGEYEDAKQDLVEMAAFLGQQLVRYMGGEWTHFQREGFESCIISKIKSNRMPAEDCLGLLVGGYGSMGMQWPRNTFLELYETRTI